jgi:hypothetical protein
MKTLSILFVMAVVAAPARAAPLAPSSPATPSATTATAEGQTTVGGVTVIGKPPSGKRCRETDKACLLVVAKEIWDKYPREITLYCEKERMRRFTDRMNKEAMFGNSDTPGVETNIDSHLPPALDVVCSYKPTPPSTDKPAN